MIRDNTENSDRLVSPLGQMGVPVSPLAPRSDTLDNKTIAFLWDSVFRGDEIFPVIQQQLDRRFNNVRFVGYETFGSTFGGDEEAVLQALPDRLQEAGVDAVVSGMGC